MLIEKLFVKNFLFAFALIMLMFRIGLSLDLDHLPKVLKNKRALITGLFLQLIVLPLLGFLIVILFDFSFEIEAGIIVITVCPGGWVSNMVSTKLKGDVDLSISLTTFSTLLSVFSAPFYLFLLLFFFYPTHYENFSLYLVVGKISLWVVIPVLLGLIIHYRSVQIGSSLLKIIRPTSIIFILLIVIAAAIEEGEHFAAYFKKIGLILFGLNVSAMVLSYYVAKNKQHHMKNKSKKEGGGECSG